MTFKIIKASFIFLFAVTASFFYLYRLNTIPSGLYVDEAIVGYNAYSILQTGRDEYGQAFPVAFKFFGSYTPPLFVYLDTIFIHFLGLTPLALRLPSALMGTITAILIGLIAKLIYPKNKLLPYIISLITLLTPWQLFYSRVGYEVYFGLFLLTLSFFFLLKSFRFPRLLFVALPLLSLSAYTSHSQRLLVPIFFFLFILIFRRFLAKNPSDFWNALILSLIIQIPNLYLLTTPAFWVKTSLFAANSPLTALRVLLSQFFVYLSPRSLFFLSDPDPQRSLPQMSLFYWWLFIPYIVGLFQLFHHLHRPVNRLILISLISSLIPASLASDPLSSQRALPSLLPLILIMGIGLKYFLGRHFRSILLSLAILIPISALFLWRSYFILFPKLNASSWNYGYDQLAQFIQLHPDDHFVIDAAKPVYPILAFYLSVSPIQFQQQFTSTDYYHHTSFTPNRSFSQIEFRPIFWQQDVYRSQIIVSDALAVSADQAREHCLEPVFSLTDPLGKPAINAYRTHPDRKRSLTPHALCY